MLLAIAIVVAAAAVAGAVVVAILARRARQPDGVSDGFDPLDTAELGARFAVVSAEHADDHGRRLGVLVQQLVDRGVPARAVVVVPGSAEVRIRFADGTTVLASGSTAGDLGRLAAVIRECSATPASCSTDASGTTVTFAWLGCIRRLSVRVIGIDQPT